MDFNALRSAWDGIQVSWSLSEKINTAWIDSMGEVGMETGVRGGGRIIAMDDTDTDKGYLVIDGDISIQKKDSPEIVKPGPELIGEMGQMNPSRVRTASVTASTDVRLIQFSWSRLNGALLKRLNEEEMTALKSALQQYAWGHFTE